MKPISELTVDCYARIINAARFPLPAGPGCKPGPDAIITYAERFKAIGVIALGVSDRQLEGTRVVGQPHSTFPI
jgi:hypothetical protein